MMKSMKYGVTLFRACVQKGQDHGGLEPGRDGCWEPTFSGPDCTGCSANGGESEHVVHYTDSMHTSYVQETKKRDTPNTNRDTNIRNIICINVHEQDTTPTSSRTKP